MLGARFVPGSSSVRGKTKVGIKITVRSYKMTSYPKVAMNESVRSVKLICSNYKH